MAIKPEETLQLVERTGATCRRSMAALASANYAHGLTAAAASLRAAAAVSATEEGKASVAKALTAAAEELEASAALVLASEVKRMAQS